jgi:ribosomal protein L20
MYRQEGRTRVLKFADGSTANFSAAFREAKRTERRANGVF